MSSHRELKVLWVVPVPDFGGVARHTLDMARAGIPGYELVVLAPAGVLTERLKEMGVHVIEAEFGPHAGFKRSFTSLLRAIEDENPAIVHSHLAYADVLAAAVVNSLKIRRALNRSLLTPKLFTTEHGIAGDDSVYHGTSWRSKLMEQVHRVRLWGTDTAIAVSASTAEQMHRKWGARTVELVYNGVDIDAVHAQVDAYRVPAEPDAPRILSLSRLSPEKGINVLIDAFARLHEHYPKARLEIAGDGELSAALREQAQRLNLGDSVTFSGFIDPHQAMGRSDMVVQLSVWENCSYTLLDAKSAGLKVVATAVGGNPEVVSARELVERSSPNLTEQVFSRIHVLLLEGPSEQFTWPNNATMAQQTAALYTNKLPRGGTR